jgi:hypothetical protein
VDVAEPPRIVLESPEACADAPRLEGLLRGALARARAPGDAWSVDVKIERTDDAHELRARAGITDASGVQVARRVLSNHAADCEGLARAVGVWASLVFEAQLAREHSARDDAAEPDAQRDGPPEAGGGAGSGKNSATRDSDDEPGAGAGTTARSSGKTAGGTPTATKPDIRVAGPTPEDPLAPESDGASANDRLSTLEVGSGAFVMALGSAALGGLSMHAALGRAPGPFLRPAIFVGETWTPSWMSDSKTYLNSTWTAARVDGCLRLPLSSEPRQGFQLDPCVGTEVGSRQAGGTSTTGVSFGPAIDVRKELGSGIAATLRGVGGIDVAGSEPRVTDRLSARLELALSSGIW